MKYAVSNNTEVEKIPRDTEEIHMTRPIKSKTLKKLLEKCHINMITLSNSCFQRLSPKTRKIANEKGAQFAIEKKRGRAISIPLKTLLYIIELKRDYQSIREIERLTGIPKSTVHYLIKYAKRVKVKKGKEIIYLK
ncbi:MAG: hypothetical protein NTZ73_03650 [Candidatus Diapherotrites archaeon]|nr:hypothetical protein [Candidatus Diapherotrites archaeon]